MKAAHHRDDKPAAFAHRERAKIFRRLPGVVLAGLGVEAVNRRSVDVDPPQHTGRAVPVGCLAELSFGIDHAFDFDHGVLPPNGSAGGVSRLRPPRIAAAMSEKASLASETVTRITRP